MYRRSVLINELQVIEHRVEIKKIHMRLVKNQCNSRGRRKEETKQAGSEVLLPRDTGQREAFTVAGQWLTEQSGWPQGRGWINPVKPTINFSAWRLFCTESPSLKAAASSARHSLASRHVRLCKLAWHVVEALTDNSHQHGTRERKIQGKHGVPTSSLQLFQRTWSGTWQWVTSCASS